MVEMGFGLSREDVMRVTFVIAEKTGKKHPFKDGMAGRGWFDGFRACHPKLTLRTPHPLSYNRALGAMLMLLKISLRSLVRFMLVLIFYQSLC